MASNYQYPLKTDKELIEKLKTIAELEGRSLNKQIEFLIRRCVLDYEKSNGEITL